MTINNISYRVRKSNFDKSYYIASTLFSGGEVHPSILESGDYLNSPADLLSVGARITSSDDFMALLTGMEILRRNFCNRNTVTTLLLPYFPYGRQDRATTPNTAFSLKVAANLINNLGFDKVTTWDAHSNVLQGLVNNLVDVPQHVFVESFFKDYRISTKGVALVAPDLGASKKASLSAEALGVPLVQCTKVRDPATGKLTQFKCLANRVPKDCIVIDDICDGGRTFLAIADLLRSKGAEKLTLFTTHGIYSQGTKCLMEPGKFDEVYAANILFPAIADDVERIPTPAAAL